VCGGREEGEVGGEERRGGREGWLVVKGGMRNGRRKGRRMGGRK